MRLTGNPTPSTAALDYDSTLIGALELISKKWVFAVQLPGVKKHSRHVVEPNGPALAELIERLKSRSAGAGRPITRVIITHEAGRDGFWLACFFGVVRGRGSCDAIVESAGGSARAASQD